MFWDLWDLAVDVVTLPVTVATVITDEVLWTELTEVTEDIKDAVKWN